ncbi:MAG: flagellar biosynthesis protein FlhB [Pseudomonadota bacterium]
MAGDEDQSQKTEDPTQKKLEDAKKKGDAPKSQEVTTWVSLAMAGLMIAAASGPLSASLSGTLATFLGEAHALPMDGPALTDLMAELSVKVAVVVGPIVLALMVAAVAANLAQQSLIFTTEKMNPKLSKISPVKGAQRLFGMQGLMNFIKGLLKLIIIGVVMVFILWPERDLIFAVISSDPAILPSLMKSMTLKLVGAAVAALFFIAAIDYIYQRYDFQKRNKMSKQEVKDEQKQIDGDPHVKARLRQIRMERANKRMMASVPDATVVIANPTHFAVALKYEPGQDGAPLCIAKGADYLALKIREVAEENKVPVVENPPLARALHAAVDVDEEVTPEHYQAVAEVIGFVMRLSGKKARRA